MTRRRVEIGLGAAGLLIAVFVLWRNCGVRECPDVDRLRGYQPDEASVILDRDGQELAKLFLERRVLVALEDLPESVPNAFVAMEDQRFWTHHGVDWRRVFGAGWKNIKAMGVAEGASTITMQLARNVFPESLPSTKRTMWRKLREARVATEIERKFTKRQILGLYLNQIYFGNAAHGIETAAQEYFGKPATELTLAEAATLAAVPKGPARFNPRDNPERSLTGRRVVLGRMARQGMITAADARAAGAVALQLRQGRLSALERAPYFVEAVRLLLDEKVGMSVYSKGFTIHTTLDLATQTAVEEELAAQLLAIESGAYGAYPHPTYAAGQRAGGSGPDGTPYLQAAAVFMDAKSGDVRALVGGRDYQDSQYNRATQAMRQPGSAFKPFVYAAAVAAGYPPSYRILDSPLRLVGADRRPWEPGNYDGTYGGAVTMRAALTQSRNVPTVRLGMAVGVDRVVRMARKIGLKGRIPSVPSVLLGAAEVTPLDLTSAFSTFATLGRNAEPRLVTSVEDRDGVVIWSREPVITRALAPAIAYIVTSMLKDVIDRGTGAAVRAEGFTGVAAGKTGTTDDAADVWFVGYTPQTVGTVWMGFDTPRTVLRGATGGELAAPVWGRVMRRVGGGSRDWPMPEGVVRRLADEHGRVFGEHCPVMAGTHFEYFLSGVASVTSCNRSPMFADADSFSWYATDSIPYERGWRTRLNRRLFSPDTTPVDPPDVAVATDSVPR